MRAKFQCNSVTDCGPRYEVAKLSAVYSGTPEDNQFAAATPSGTVEMSISAEAARGFFKPGKKYYADFIEAAE